MSQITTHILDTATGRPAQNVPITLLMQQGKEWSEIGTGLTNEDGRIADLFAAEQVLDAGTYRMHFDTKAYFSAMGEAAFYPWVDVVFSIETGGQHYHIPLLLSPFAYSTYRGS